MITKLTKLAAFAIIAVVFNFSNATQANAQFSKAVVLLKGSIHTEQTGKAYSVRVSVRSTEDKNVEITGSNSNSETGNYLVVLQANKKYWIHLESPDITTQDELIETPAADSTITMNKDFTVTSTTNTSQDKAIVMDKSNNPAAKLTRCELRAPCANQAS